MSIVAVPALVTGPVVGVLGVLGFGSGGIVGGKFVKGLEEHQLIKILTSAQVLWQQEPKQ